MRFLVCGETGFAATDIVGVRGTRPLDTLKISIEYSRSSSVVPMNTIAGGGTGSVAAGIVGVVVLGLWILNIRYWKPL